MLRSIASFIYHKVIGWEAIGYKEFHQTKKCVIIVVPHTSWHDFYIGILIRQVLGIRISFLGKKELFNWPFGWYFRRVGGIALDRTSGQNKVEAIAGLFKQREVLRLSLAPEGTRKKVTEWKTGFYHIAKTAQVPIVMVSFDFGKKQNVISEPFFPTDNQEKDFKFMYQFYKGVLGKVPAYSFDPE